MKNNIIFDANNHVRRILERDNTGMPLRTFYNDLISNHCRRGNVFVIWDGFKANARRREIYPEYKNKRIKPAESVFETFKMCEELLAFAPVIQAKVPTYEADDVVANLAIYFAMRGEQVEIHSTDYDFMQLSGVYPHQIFVGAKPKEGVPSDLVSYYKVTVGDGSDNISGVAGFGKGTWEKLGGAKIADWVNEVIFHDNDNPQLEGLPPRVKLDPDKMRREWKIINFFELTMEEIAEHFKVGKADYIGGNNFLKAYMQ